MNKGTFLLLSFFLFSFQTHSAENLFSNSFILLNPPQGWSCALDGTITVCRNLSLQKSQEAIIIIAAKKAAPEDKLEIYKEYLSKPISNRSERTLKPFQSEIKAKPESVLLSNHQWITSMHYNSEVENYLTTYVGTVKDGIAILVTMSVHKNYHTKYSSIFNRVLKSIKTKNQPQLSPNIPTHNNPLLNPSTRNQISNSTDLKPPHSRQIINLPPPLPAKKKFNIGLLFIAIAIGLVGYLLLKKKK